MSNFHVELGESVVFSKTVGESDIYMFAGITGDFSGNHVNEQYMEKSAFMRPGMVNYLWLVWALVHILNVTTYPKVSSMKYF